MFLFTVFFVEITPNGNSILYPFDRFNERFDKKIEKAYLDGRYGAIPIFDSIFFPPDDDDNEQQSEEK